MRLRRLAAEALLRRSTAPPADALLRGGPIHMQTGRGLGPRAGEAVASEIRRLVGDGLLSTGIQVAARVRGEPLVSVWGGCCPATGLQVKETSLMMPWSVAKGVASTALLVVAAREGLSFDVKVVSLWPEFARGGRSRGKAEMTVADAMGYRGGLTGHPGLHWQAMQAMLGGWQRHWQYGVRFIEECEPEWC